MRVATVVVFELLVVEGVSERREVSVVFRGDVGIGRETGSDLAREVLQLDSADGVRKAAARFLNAEKKSSAEPA